MRKNRYSGSPYRSVSCPSTWINCSKSECNRRWNSSGATRADCALLRRILFTRVSFLLKSSRRFHSCPKSKTPSAVPSHTSFDTSKGMSFFPAKSAKQPPALSLQTEFPDIGEARPLSVKLYPAQKRLIDMSAMLKHIAQPFFLHSCPPLLLICLFNGKALQHSS